MNLIVIIADSLRVDHVGCYGGRQLTPNIDGLADDSALFEQVFGEILQEVSSDVIAIDEPYHTVFIEFARKSYLDAIKCFDRVILESCLMIYMQVSFETCWERNVARHQAALERGGDDHLVPRAEMERLYLIDDRDAFFRTMKERRIPIVVVDNEREGEEHLIRQVETLYQELF